MSGVIYIITSGDEGYVGSTFNYEQRMKSHKCAIYNENGKDYNYKLYKTIRANGGEWEMSIYEDNLSMSKKELWVYEDKVMLLLGATLNSKSACSTIELRKKQSRANDFKQNIKKKVPVQCECGSILRSGDMVRHRKSAKHARLMTSLSQA